MPPPIVAVSLITPPVATDGDAVVKMPPPGGTSAEARVVSVGVTGVTVTFSFASLHAVATGRLLASPLYDAIQRYTPAAVVVKLLDGYEPLPATATLDVKIGA